MNCPNCQQVNPTGTKFCPECGVNLQALETGHTERQATSYTPRHLVEKVLTSRSALEGERKLVTVLFCDIANSTPLASRLGADAMHALLNRFFELALAEVHFYEGTINQFLGDGFMALFGAPVAHEDHARRGMLAALGIKQRLEGIVGTEPLLGEVQVRMGINIGMVVVGKIGDNLRMDYTAVGDTTNLAARLQQSAQPGSIRVSSSTQRTASTYFDFKALGSHTLKGIAEPVPLYELLRAHSATDSLGVAEAGVSSPLVGREEELGILKTSLSALHQGEGVIVFLTGEPGVGKSRLLAEARRSAEADGIRWLEGRSLSFGKTLSYWPFIEILKRVFGIDESDTEPQAWSKLERSCAELFAEQAEEILPYLGTVLALQVPAPHDQRVKYLDPQALGRQVFLSMRRFFERLTRQRPTLVLMEDWHWVDHSSVALCEHLLPLSESNAITFWFAARSEPKEAMGRMQAAAQETEKPLRTQQVALTPLAGNQSVRLLENLVGANSLPESLRAQILRKTEGNPFFMEEIIRALIADGVLVRESRGQAWRLRKSVDAITLPDTVQGVIVARIDRLEEGVKDALKLASAIGRSFFLRILQAISEAGQQLDSNLQRLQQAEFIRLRQQMPELEYIFKHALVQEAAYGSILAGRRKAIHSAVGQAIENLFSERLDEFMSVLAYHYARAEDWDKAQEYLFKAGDQAGRLSADAEALDHYNQALVVYNKASGGPRDSVQRATVDRKIGEALFGRGEHERALEHFASALAKLGRSYPNSRGAVRRAMLRQILRQLGHRYLPRLFLVNMTGQARAAAAEKKHIYHIMAWIHYFFDSESMVLDTLLELNSSESAGLEPADTAVATSTFAGILTLIGATGIGARYFRRADNMKLQTQNPIARGLCDFFGSWHELYQGRWDSAIGRLENAASAFHAAGDIRFWGFAIAVQGVIRSSKGDTKILLEIGQKLLRAGQDTGNTHLQGFGAHAITLGCRRGGAADYAIDWGGKAIKLYERVPDSLSTVYALSEVAGCYLDSGKLDEALSILEQSNDLLRRIGAKGHQVTTSRLVTAEAYLAMAERYHPVEGGKSLRQAKQACSAALRQSRHVQDEGVPHALRLFGVYWWLRGNHAAADTFWTRSITEALRLGARYALRSTHLERGKRLGRQQDLDIAAAIGEELKVDARKIAAPA